MKPTMKRQKCEFETQEDGRERCSVHGSTLWTIRFVDGRGVFVCQVAEQKSKIEGKQEKLMVVSQ